MQEIKTSMLTLENQTKLTLTGVSSVLSFSDTAILLTVGGKRVQLQGARLKVLAFSEGTGNFAASGEFHAIRFGAAGTFKKLFK